ncbi:MAG: 50S ribosomal protein L10 [candidate division WOR-3 bacterium]
MPSAQKIKAVENYTKILENVKAMYVVDFTGFNVAELNELRKKIREEKGLLKVGKNTLFKIALNNLKIEGLEKFLTGVSALLLAYDDPVSPLKVFYEYSKEKEKGKIKGGYIEGRIISEEDVNILAKLPPKNVLIQNLISRIGGPLYGFLFVLNGLLRNLLYVLVEIKNKKEGSNP